MEQQQHKGKIEGFLAEFGRKLDQLMDKARHETEQPRVADRLDELRQAKDKLERELQEFVKDDQKWQEVQQRLQGAALELKKAVEAAFSKRGEQQQPPHTPPPTTNSSDYKSGDY